MTGVGPWTLVYSRLDSHLHLPSPNPHPQLDAGKLRCRHIDLLSEKQTGPPDYYVIHSHQMPFMDLVEVTCPLTLVSTCPKPPDPNPYLPSNCPSRT